MRKILILSVLLLSAYYLKDYLDFNKDTRKTASFIDNSPFQFFLSQMTLSFNQKGKIKFLQISLRFHLDNKETLDELEESQENIKEFVGLSVSAYSLENKLSSVSFRSLSKKIKEDLNYFLSSGKIKDISVESIKVLEG